MKYTAITAIFDPYEHKSLKNPIETQLLKIQKKSRRLQKIMFEELDSLEKNFPFLNEKEILEIRNALLQVFINFQSVLNNKLSEEKTQMEKKLDFIPTIGLRLSRSYAGIDCSNPKWDETVKNLEENDWKDMFNTQYF